ncbi:MAG: hypothetical protein ACLUPV_10955, partial [Bilophila wadsworthia]
SKTFGAIESLLASFPVNRGVRRCFSSYNEKRRRKKSFAFFSIRDLSYPSSSAHTEISDEGFDKDESLWRGRGEVWRGKGDLSKERSPFPPPIILLSKQAL